MPLRRPVESWGSSNPMKALVKSKPEEGLWLQHSIPIPEPGPNDVRIKIEKTSICGTDIHIYEWDEWAQRTVPVPLVTGHEYVGIIEKMGREVKDLELGQRVSGEGHIVGSRSRNSRAGRFHLDPETRGVGVNWPGAFADYLVLPAFNVIPLPAHVSSEVGAILDPFGNAVHTVLSFDVVGEDVLITGAGPIGIMSAAVARHAGARHIVLTDVNPYRLNLAHKVEPNIRTVDVTREDLKEVMRDLGMKEGFDVGLEMSGAPVAFEQMIDNMIMGGRIGMLGIPAGKMPTDWSKIIFKALTIKAIYGREMFDTWYKMLAILESGLNLEPLITHHFPIEAFEDGFAAMRSGQSG
ncbi:MAG: L-threonine 3-dehydrogenase, partial [Chloroflexota bacterium]